MRRVLANDTGAFSALYDRHAGPVYGLALRMLRDRSAAEDVTEEAFTAFWRSRHHYRPERGSPGGWLLTITRDRAIDAIRRGRAPAPERAGEQALELSYFGGLNHTEIAARLGIPLGTVTGRMRLALEQLAAERGAPPAVATPA